MAWTALLPVVGKVIERIFPDKEAADKAKLELLALQQSGEIQKIMAASEVVKAEAQSEHWIVASWRPIMMLVFVAIVANNYLLYPYLSLFWGDAVKLDLPNEMWELLKIGVGGYIIGRSGEKIADKVKKNG